MNDSDNKASLIKEAFADAVNHHQAGRLVEAEEIYRAILQLEPQHPDSNHNLGLLALQLNQAAAALQLLNTALTAAPAESRFWLSYIEALASVGETAAAQDLLQLSRKYGFDLRSATIEHLIQAAAAQSLALAVPVAPALDLVRSDAIKQPSSAEQQALSDAFQNRDFKKMELLAQALADKYPHAIIGWQGLSQVYFHTQRFEQALQPTQQMLALQPQDAQMHANLGLILWRLQRLDEAEASFQHAIAMAPEVADSHTNLGNVYKDQERLGEAMSCYRRAIALDPQQAAAYSNLGYLHSLRQAFREAESCFRKSLELQANNAFALRNLSSVLTQLGNLTEAEAVIRQAIALEPDNILAYDLLLFLFNYTHIDKAGEARELAEHYGQLLAARRNGIYRDWLCVPQPTRLKVGLVSADLHTHPVGFFLESLLSKLNSERIELIAYVHMPEQKHDALTARLQPYFSAWKSIYRLTDADAAALIHADGIHVLLDLSGHTTDNRLPVFAYKPAPVQASWLGYFATTGVTEMDYLIGDPYLCPPAEAAHFTEKVWSLPDTWLCFTPPAEDIPISPLPALQNGHITFGCFNNLNKMNDAVVALWAELLQGMPSARLFLKAAQLRDPAVQAQTSARFAAHGIAAEQLILEGPSPRKEYLASYARVDIALDPFPYPGGATSVEALWMGVPVLTLRGNRFLAHLGESIAHNAGLSGWIASDKAEYIQKARAHASDLTALASLRAGLRRQMHEGPLLDAIRFAQGFEDALWGMWTAPQNRLR